VKLLDFGIARMREPSSEAITGSVPGTLGTPGFMPPEQARGLWEELDARTDLWAVGAILYRALAGRSVHTGRTPSEILLAAMTKRAGSLADTLTEAPDTLVALVDQALAFEPDQRFSDAKAFQQAVGAVYQSITGKPIEEAVLAPTPVTASAPVDGGNPTQAAAFGTTVPGPTAARTTSWMRPALIAATLAAIGAALLFVVRQTEDPPGTAAPAATSETAAPRPPPPAAEPDIRVAPAAPTASATWTETAPPASSARTVKSRPSATAKSPQPVQRPKSEDDVLDQRK
jgi:serine/threonine-protein kinase